MTASHQDTVTLWHEVSLAVNEQAGGATACTMYEYALGAWEMR